MKCSSRFSVSNRFRPITFAQFFLLVDEFKSALEKSFSAGCRLEIRALKTAKYKYTQAKYDDDLADFIQAANREATFFQTDALSDVTMETYQSAVCLEVSFFPLEGGGPRHAFGKLEFGSRSRTVDCYLQPGDDSLVKQMRRSHRGQIFKEG